MEEKESYLKLSQEINELEKRLKSIEELQDKNELKGAVRITGSLEITKLNRIDLSESKLVEVYNDCPQLLEIYAIQANLTPESYRQTSEGKIWLNKVIHGNYWIIATENDTYWLFPALKASLNVHKIRTIKRLFECRGEEGNDFILSQPARVSIMPSGEEWKLEEPGILDFAKNKAVQSQTEIDRTHGEIKQLSSELARVQQQYQQSQSQLDKLLSLFKQSEADRQRMQAQIQQLSQERELVNQKLEIIEVNLSPNYAELLTAYDREPDLLAERAIAVSETTESIHQRQAGSNKAVVFEKNDRGVYWIFNLDNFYYLVYNKSKIKINEHSIKTVEVMFECRGWQPDKSSDFKLVKPAKVTPIAEDKWELVELGRLQFISSPAQEIDWETFDRLEIAEVVGEIVEEPTPPNWQQVQLRQTLTGHTNSVRSLAIGHLSGQNPKPIVVSGSFDNSIKIWDLDSGKLMGTLTGAEMVNAIALSPDGQTIVSSGEQNTIELWQLNTAQRRTLGDHSDWILALAVSLDGQTLVSGSRNSTIKIWHLPTGELRHTITGNYSGVLAIAISPDGQTLVSSHGDNTIRMWHVPTGELLPTHFRHSDLIWSITISPDGQTIVTGSRDRTIKLWNLQTGELQQTLDGHAGSVWSVNISPDGQTLASGSEDKTIKLWNLPTGELLSTLTGHTKEIYTVAIAPNGQTLVSGSRDNTIKIWEAGG
jgi:WD40 repeat protein